MFFDELFFNNMYRKGYFYMSPNVGSLHSSTLSQLGPLTPSGMPDISSASLNLILQSSNVSLWLHTYGSLLSLVNTNGLRSWMYLAKLLPNTKINFIKSFYNQMLHYVKVGNVINTHIPYPCLLPFLLKNSIPTTNFLARLLSRDI